MAHVADALVFRLAGGLILWSEISQDTPADWHVLVAGFAMFFMPDALRGKDSLLVRAANRIIDGRPPSES